MSGMIPEDFIQQVKDTANIRSIVSEYVQLKKSGRTWMGRCPFHDDKDPSFSINEERQIYYCFGCGEGGDVFKFLMKIRGMSFTEAVKYLADRLGLNIPQRPVSPHFRKKKEREELLVQLNEAAVAFYHERLRFSPDAVEAREYLERRGVSRAIIEEFHLGWAPEGWSSLAEYLETSGYDLNLAADVGLLIEREKRGGWYDRFRGRIIFPILDRFGRPVALGGRILGDGLPKYLNSPESPIYKKSKVLFGLYHSKGAIRRKRMGFVVEGYMDYLALVQAGIKEVVATLGTALTEDHIKVLKGLCKEWYLVFDGDKAGLKAAAKAVPLFYAHNLRPKVILLPEGLDPDTLIRAQGKESWWQLAEEALPGLDFIIHRSLEEFGTDTEGRYKAAQEILKLLQRVTDPIRKSLLISRAAESLSVPERSIWDALEREQSGTAPVKAPASHSPLSSNASDRGRKKNEEYILGFLLNFPHYIPEFIDTNMELWLEGEYSKRLWEFIRNCALAGNIKAESTFYEELERADDPVREISLRLREKCPPCEDINAVASRLLEYCRERHTKWLRQELITRMKERDGLEEEKLLKEYQQLL